MAFCGTCVELGCGFQSFEGSVEWRPGDGDEFSRAIGQKDQAGHLRERNGPQERHRVGLEGGGLGEEGLAVECAVCTKPGELGGVAKSTLLPME